jgi:hypothetical protein
MTSSTRLSYITGLDGIQAVAVMAVLFYITNWVYIVREVPYFEAFGRPRLLRQLWSLASAPALLITFVKEQSLRIGQSHNRVERTFFGLDGCVLFPGGRPFMNLLWDRYPPGGLSCGSFARQALVTLSGIRGAQERNT